MREDDPLASLVSHHEESCPCPDLAGIRERLRAAGTRQETLQQLTGLVAGDLGIRSRAAAGSGLSVALELFYFGRPLFQLLAPLGVVTRESPAGLVLEYRP